jgi:hypothetical protein
MNLDLLVPEPPCVLTVIRPLACLEGSRATILVYERTRNLARSPPNITDVAPASACPLMVTLIPRLPLVGLKLLIVGLTLKDPELVAVPLAVVTVTRPVRAPAGTVALICE